jgi:hypothetical protein
VTFAEFTGAFVGWEQTFWLSDTDSWEVVRQERRGESIRENAGTWTPSSSHFLYTRQVLTYTNHYTVTFGPRQIWSVDSRSGEERVLIDDSSYDFFVTGNWRGEWLQVWSTPYRVVTTTLSPSGKQWASLYCTVDGRDCADVQNWAMNWHTGELLPWDDAPLPTMTPSPWPVPTFTPLPTPMPTLASTPGPNLAAPPVYVDPAGALALYAGQDGIGLWRVSAEGKPGLLVEDGHHFVYVP